MEILLGIILITSALIFGLFVKLKYKLTFRELLNNLF